MRVFPIGDLHGHLPDTPACDLLIIAGDICPVIDHGIDRQHRWMENDFSDWLLRQPAEKIIGIAGNHDFIAQYDEPFMRTLPWTYLCDESVEINGVKIFGSPWTPMFYNWAFMEDDDQLELRWKAIPDDTQILLTHGPPRGFGDMTRRGITAGSLTLLSRIVQLKILSLHIFGHIHEDPGVWTFDGKQLVNCTYVNLNYEPWDRPQLTIEMEVR